MPFLAGIAAAAGGQGMIVNGEYVKGNICLDKSFKDMMWGRPRNHNEYRADVTYNGVRERMRSKNYETCVQFLLDLKQSHLAEYTKTCDWCGSVFALTAHNSQARYCCPGCAKQAAKKRREKSCGMSFINEHGQRIKPPKRKYKGG